MKPLSVVAKGHSKQYLLKSISPGQAGIVVFPKEINQLPEVTLPFFAILLLTPVRGESRLLEDESQELVRPFLGDTVPPRLQLVRQIRKRSHPPPKDFASLSCSGP